MPHLIQLVFNGVANLFGRMAEAVHGNTCNEI